MHAFKYRKPDLRNRRDANIIAHVFRNFITTSEVVHRLFFNGLSVDTSRKVLKRLREKDLLARYHIAGNRYYFRLGRASLARWGYPRSRSEKLGAQRLPYEIGTLAAMCFGGRPRKRLLPHELKNRLPWFPDSLMQWAYLWEENTLGSIRVEARCSRPDRLVTKLSDQVYSYCANDEFRELVEQGRFFLIVILATEPQELAVQYEIEQQRFSIPVQTMHYEELVRFI